MVEVLSYKNYIDKVDAGKLTLEPFCEISYGAIKVDGHIGYKVDGIYFSGIPYSRQTIAKRAQELADKYSEQYGEKIDPVSIMRNYWLPPEEIKTVDIIDFTFGDFTEPKKTRDLLNGGVCMPVSNIFGEEYVFTEESIAVRPMRMIMGGDYLMGVSSLIGININLNEQEGQFAESLMSREGTDGNLLIINAHGWASYIGPRADGRILLNEFLKEAVKPTNNLVILSSCLAEGFHVEPLPQVPLIVQIGKSYDSMASQENKARLILPGS